MTSSISHEYELSMDDIVIFPRYFSTLTLPSTVVMLTLCSVVCIPSSVATSESKMSLSEPPSSRAQNSLESPVVLFVSLTGTNDRAMLSLPSTRSAKIAASHLECWFVVIAFSACCWAG